jgi:hypothetical protein
MMAYTKRDRQDSKFGRDFQKNFGNFLGRGTIDPGGQEDTEKLAAEELTNSESINNA